MYDFYEQFYRATATSAAHAVLCERAYGRNFAQHGFADIEQMDALIRVAGLMPGSRVLELGCGNGSIAEYISDATGARVTGIDYAPTAIAQARERTLEKADRLSFLTCEMSALPFPPASFDAVIAIDTLYFADLDVMLARLRELLAPAGQILTSLHPRSGSHESDRDFPARDTPSRPKSPRRGVSAAGLRLQILGFLGSGLPARVAHAGRAARTGASIQRRRQYVDLRLP
jgi:cyclopropane fatty-acyl-phospholipid synthase-like methyltransferase